MNNYSRRSKVFTLTLLLMLSSFTLELYAQNVPAPQPGTAFRPYIYLNGNAQAAFPLQVFKQKGQKTAYGGGGLVLFQLGPRPMFLGLEASMLRFDSEQISFEETINGLVEEFRQTTKNNLFLAHVVTRVQPWDNSLFRPYLDGLFGVKNLYTRTTLENLETEDRESNTNAQDWTLSYGFALGLQLGLFNNEAITIDLRFTYLTGNSARFLVRDPNATGPFFLPIEAFEEQIAPPAMLIPQIGVSVDLTTVDYY